jgi:catechol-2,3-dioxygenase
MNPHHITGEPSMVHPTKLSHVVLKTYDIRRLREWYCTVLGAHVVFEHLPYSSYITYDDEHHRLAFGLIPGPPMESISRSPSVTHLGFTFCDIRTLLSHYERLRELGIRPVFSVNHYLTFSFYYQDPDKNNVELQIDRISLEDGTRYMNGPDFAANNLGVEVDGDALVRKMHAGASDGELLYFDRSAMVDAMTITERYLKATHSM